MSRLLLFILLVLVGGLFWVSCTGRKDLQDKSQAFDSVTLTPYSGATAVAITHEVRDYAGWLSAYTAHSDPNSRWSIYSSPEDNNLITVFELTRSHDEARTAFLSPEFRKMLEDEGVIGDPVLSYFDIKFRVSTPTNKKYRLGVSHEVNDYNHWKKIFDEDENIRMRAKLELRAISTSADNPSMVNILFATDNVDKAKDVINSEELRRRMNEAGVRTEPVFAVFRVPLSVAAQH